MLTPFVLGTTVAGGILVLGIPLLFSSLLALRYPVRANEMQRGDPIPLEPAEDKVDAIRAVDAQCPAGLLEAVASIAQRRHPRPGGALA